jgi:heme-degrading monooxygenase HmoA
MTSEDYASGMWLVKAGSEDAFIERWREWLTTSSSGVDGFEGAHLLRSNDDPRRFVSYSGWRDVGARDAWKQSEAFGEGFAACRAYCDDFQGGDFTAVVQT